MPTVGWVVVVGEPPWHFGPFESEGEAKEYAKGYGGWVWPLWDPETTDAELEAEL